MNVKFIKNWRHSNLMPGNTLTADVEFYRDPTFYDWITFSGDIANTINDFGIEVGDEIKFVTLLNNEYHTVTAIMTGDANPNRIEVAETVIFELYDEPFVELWKKTEEHPEGEYLGDWDISEGVFGFTHNTSITHTIIVPDGFDLQISSGDAFAVSGTQYNDGTFVFSSQTDNIIIVANLVTNEVASDVTFTNYILEIIKTSDDFKLVEEESDYDAEKYIGKDFFMHEPRKAKLTFLNDTWLEEAFSKDNLLEEINVYLFFTEEGQIIEYDGDSPPYNWVVGFDTGDGIIDKIEILIANLSKYVVEIYEDDSIVFTGFVDKTVTKLNNDTIEIEVFDTTKLVDKFGESLIFSSSNSDKAIIASDSIFSDLMGKLCALTNLNLHSWDGVFDNGEMGLVNFDEMDFSSTLDRLNGEYHFYTNVSFFGLVMLRHDCEMELVEELTDKRFMAFTGKFNQCGAFTVAKVKVTEEINEWYSWWGSYGDWVSTKEVWYIVIVPWHRYAAFIEGGEEAGKYKEKDISVPGTTIEEIKTIEQAIEDLKNEWEMTDSGYYHETRFSNNYFLIRYVKFNETEWGGQTFEQENLYSGNAVPVFPKVFTYKELLRTVLFIGKANLYCDAYGTVRIESKDRFSIENPISIFLNQIENDWTIEGMEVKKSYIPKALNPIYPDVVNDSIEYNLFYSDIQKFYKDLIKNNYPRVLKGKIIINRVTDGIQLGDCLTFKESYWKIVEGKILDDFRYEFRALEIIFEPGFNSTWKTDNAGDSDNDQIELPLIATGTYDFIVYWGDGNSDTITAHDDAEKTHTYSSAGTYNVTIEGQIEGWQFDNGGDKLKITDVSHWGNLIVGVGQGRYFRGCSNMTVSATDVPKLDNVSSLNHMFTYCNALDMNFEQWDLSNIEDIAYMLYNLAGDISISSANLGTVKFWTITNVTDADNFMKYCTNSMSTADYSELLIRWEDQTHQDDVTIHFNDATYDPDFELDGFDNTAGEARVALVNDGWDIADGTLIPAFISTWQTDNEGDSEDNQITLPLISGNHNFDVKWGDGTTDHINAYDDAEITHTYPEAGTYEVEIEGQIEGWQFNDGDAVNGGDKLKITDISHWGNLIVGTDEGHYFYGCHNMTVSATDVLDVSSVTSFYQAFCNCLSLTTLDVNGWDVSSVTTFNRAFRGCFDLTTLDVSNWDVSSATIFTQIFYNCTSLTTLDVSSWDVSSVTLFNWAFHSCESLTTLDVSNWDVSSVTSFYKAFYYCAFLTTLDVGNWDVSSVTTFSQAFYNCSSLTTLDVSSWNVSSVSSFYWAFYNCISLTTLDVSSWDMSSTQNIGHMLGNTDALDSSDYAGIKNWTITGLTDADNFMNGCANSMSTADYSELLIRWEDQTHQDDVTIHFNDATYDPDFELDGFDNTAGEARVALVNDGWDITDFILVIRVRRSSDQSEMDIGAQVIPNETAVLHLTTRNLDTDTLLNFVGDGDGYVTKWYDISGNETDGITLQASYQPKIVNNGSLITSNNKVAIEFDGEETNFRLGEWATSKNMSIFAVIDAVAQDPAHDGYIFDNFTDYGRALFHDDYYSGRYTFKNDTSTSTPVRIRANVSANPSQVLISVTVRSNSNEGVTDGETCIYTNGTLADSESGDIPYEAKSTECYIGTATYTPSYSFNGTMQELILYNEANEADRVTIENDINNYYGIY